MEAARTALVDTQVRPNDVTERRLTGAMLHVPRENFLPAALAGVAYSDKPLQTMNGRWMCAARDFAKLVHEASVGVGERVLDIAPGTGYSTAILSAMGAEVVALEDSDEAVAALNTHFSSNKRVVVSKGALATGAGVTGPFDVIFVNGAVEIVPDAWLDLLGEGGRLSVAVRDGAVCRARIYTKSGGAASWRTPFDCAPPQLPGFEAAETFRF